MVYVETLSVRRDLLRTFQQAFPGAKRDLPVINVFIQHVRKLKKVIQTDPYYPQAKHTLQCESMHACQRVLLRVCVYTEQNKSSRGLQPTRLDKQVLTLPFREMNLLSSGS